jgi:hypothetical protein
MNHFRSSILFSQVRGQKKAILVQTADQQLHYPRVRRHSTMISSNHPRGVHRQGSCLMRLQWSKTYETCVRT